jgi:hypothetical protein
MLNRRILFGISLAGSIVAEVAGTAFAQATKPIVGISTVTTYSADARITAVDPAARTVTLAYSNGATAVRKVGPSVASFAQAKVGDMVSVSFEDRLTFVLSGPNAKTPRDRDVSVTAAAGTGQSMAGVSADQAIANWWVTGVDPAGGKLSLVNPAGGEVRTFSVTTPEAREQLSRVKTGDYLTAIDSQAAVVSIAPKP